MTERTDEELVKIAQTGDADAFSELAVRHREIIQQRIGARIPCWSERMDVTQETLVRAFRKLGQVREPAQFAAWLGRIAEHTANAWLRGRWAQLELLPTPDASASLPDVAGSDEELLTRARLRGAYLRLSAHHREVLHHHYCGGSSYKEIAALLQVPVDTVRSRLQKARRQLQLEFDSMTEASTNAYVLTLGREDLLAIRDARRCAVAPESERHALKGVLLDGPRANIVGTDGRHILVRPTPALAAMPGRLLLAVPPGWEPPAGEAFELVPGVSEAVLMQAGKAVEAFPIISIGYPDYGAAVPDKGVVCCVLDGATLREAIEKARLLAARDSNDEAPRVRIAADPDAGALRMLFRAAGEPGAAWELAIALPAQITGDLQSAPEGIWFNTALIEDGLASAEFARAKRLVLEITSELAAAILRTDAEKPTKLALMAIVMHE